MAESISMNYDSMSVPPQRSTPLPEEILVPEATPQPNENLEQRVAEPIVPDPETQAQAPRFARDFYAYLNRNHSQAKIQEKAFNPTPMLAAAFIKRAVLYMPSYNKPENYSLLPMNSVNRKVNEIMAVYGSAGKPSPRGVSHEARAEYLQERIDFIVQRKWYVKFPEILGAATLDDQLRQVPDEHTADSLDILLAAYADVAEKLPSTYGRIIRY